MKAAIRQMFQAQEALRAAFPKKPFTPDGRMMGDIGEAIAEISYRVTIDEKLRKHWDGKWEEGTTECSEVQVRATQKEETYVKEPPHDGCLLVFKISPNGSWKCCYNGSPNRVWKSLETRRADKTGAKLIQLAALRKLNKEVAPSESISLR